MTKQELDAIKARCDAATPGPWEQTGYTQQFFDLCNRNNQFEKQEPFPPIGVHTKHSDIIQ